MPHPNPPRRLFKFSPERSTRDSRSSNTLNLITRERKKRISERLGSSRANFSYIPPPSNFSILIPNPHPREINTNRGRRSRDLQTGSRCVIDNYYQDHTETRHSGSHWIVSFVVFLSKAVWALYICITSLSIAVHGGPLGCFIMRTGMALTGVQEGGRELAFAGLPRSSASRFFAGRAWPSPVASRRPRHDGDGRNGGGNGG